MIFNVYSVTSDKVYKTSVDYYTSQMLQKVPFDHGSILKCKVEISIFSRNVIFLLQLAISSRIYGPYSKFEHSIEQLLKFSLKKNKIMF